MRLISRLLICLGLISATAIAQERITKFMAGPNGDQTRIVLALTDPLEGGYKLQSMIIDLSRIKNANEQPSFLHVDLTSTVRNLLTGAKQQKALILRWNKTGQLELKCDGKWTKHDTNPGIDEIKEVTKAVIQNIPLDAKTPTDLTLSPQLEERVSSLFDALKPEGFPCLRVDN